MSNTVVSDVIIVGAGLSGVAAGCRLRQLCPDQTFIILEARNASGGTWDQFRFPGVRSDSDMHTLGYSFKPWTESRSIVDGESILRYIRETAEQFDITKNMHFNQRVVRADWDSSLCRWNLTVKNTLFGTVETMSCRFFYVCAGFFNHDSCYSPQFEGLEEFQGQIAYPQFWPQDLDYKNKRVVVVGSGATAMTIVPELARHAKSVVMLQRSPTYVMSRREFDPLARLFFRFLPEGPAFRIIRWKNASVHRAIYQTSRRFPRLMRYLFIRNVRKKLRADFDWSNHFKPNYDPWDQRLCIVPDNNLFNTINSRSVDVVTDRISSFDKEGLVLASGNRLPAEIVVLATGLEMSMLGKINLYLDGNPVDLAQTWTYKGFAFSDIPNLASSNGYVNASFGIRASMTSVYLCRILNHMQATSSRVCIPRLRQSDLDMVKTSSASGFNPSYFQRAAHLFPKEGDRDPWMNVQDYRHDRKAFLHSPVEDGVLEFN